MKKLTKAFVGWMVFSSAIVAQAQIEDLVAITVEGRSSKPTESEASREITAWAQSTTAREQVIEVLGDSRYQKRRNEIEEKIVKQSSKFMPFVNPGAPTQAPDRTFKMPVTLKVSMPSLRRLVLESGLLNESGAPTSIAPMVALTDRRKGQSVRWWLGASTDSTMKELNDLNSEILKSVVGRLSAKGFYVAKPDAKESVLPDTLRSERPQGETLSGISKQLGTPLVLRGDVRIGSARENSDAIAGSIAFEVVHAVSGRVVADVAKSFSAKTAGKEMRVAL
ncbi:MAG TPA: hypothetical protein VM432_10410, partial [Bdellovibrionales bacterium]|nr:hypothetical protein [Bdellovibrionales bacterium]